MSPRPSVEIQRREEVLTATCEMIAEVGFHRLRVADIAERIGVSTGIIHYYFGTKRELLDHAFQHAVARARARSLVALDGVSDPWDRLVAVLEAQLPKPDAPQEWPLWVHLWAESMVRPELRELNHSTYKRWLDLVESIVVDGQEQGKFAEIPARMFSLQLLTMMDGLVIQQTLKSADVDAERVREALLSFARRSLLVTDPGQAAPGQRTRATTSV